MAFAASDLDPRSSSGKPICSYCGNIGHVREWCFKVHPELKGTSSKGKGKSQLGSLLKQQPSSSTTTLAIVFISFVRCYFFGRCSILCRYSSLPGLRCSTIPVNLDGLSRPIPLFDSPLVQIPPASAAWSPLKVYTSHTPPSASSVSGDGCFGAEWYLPLMPLPPGAKSVGSKWVFSVKFQADGSIERYKARLVDIIIVNQALEKSFDIKDRGPFRYFLGIEIVRSRRGICLSQRKYILDLLRDTGMMGYGPASTPMDSNLKLSIESWELLSYASVYQCLVGCLIYLTNTRPDITFVVSVVSQFLHVPRTSHLDVVHYILRYLKTCPGLGLFYTAKAQDGVSYFTNADYAGSNSDRHSTSELYTFYGNHLLSWKSKK
ncbi:Reverse transcriptase, RNA-dependent DNA polymerase protein [Actinidia chinensis var. chinensis]|uniref:Reverse transcriptase, RNA-dependent DNA polymerase protein n=1 Tax=Actinidia chinensis var. chinensis TaxID=1590841 RepID=A0A2R6QHM7_ACTCC|nr:Reverse transcriptase, RNA-dependent DNA polymerase protein [Actinidia chinensis var. chinensis]